jgi:hypothetical protein
MELSARDKRILADIECESALDDPRWVRRFERLGRHGGSARHGWRRVVFGAAAVLVPAAWITAVVLGAVLLRPLLWAALALGTAGLVTFAAMLLRRHRNIHGHWYRSRRRIPRIPRQSPPGRVDGSEN